MAEYVNCNIIPNRPKPVQINIVIPKPKLIYYGEHRIDTPNMANKRKFIDSKLVIIRH